MKRAHVLIAAGVLVAAAAGGFVWNERRARSGSPFSLEASSRRWGTAAADETKAYDLHWLVDSQARFVGLPGLSEQSTQELRIEVKGTLVLTELPGTPGSVALFSRILDPRLEVGGNTAASRGAMLQALGDGAFVRLDSHGTITHVAVPKSGDAGSLALWRGMWGDMQLQLLTDGLATTWEVEESDTKGRYLARYVVESSAIRKSKRRYVTDGQRRSLAADHEIVSDLSAVWQWPEGSAWPTELDLSESFRTVVRGSEMAKGTTALRLQPFDGNVPLLDPGTRRELARAFDRAVHDGEFDDLAGSKAWDSLARIQAKQELGQHTDETLEAAINQDFGLGGDDLATATYLALRARFLLDDAGVTYWFNKIKEWGANDPRALAVAETMGAAGTPACQNALAQVIEGAPQDEALAARLLPTLGMVNEPTDAAVAFIKSLAADDSYVARSSAILSLGAVGQRLRNRDAAAAAALYEDLRTRFSASSGGDKGLMMAALGNLGDKRQVDLVRPVLETADASLKVDAVRSLRFVDSDARDDVLTSVLEKEDAAEVRAAAAYALSFGNNAIVQTAQRERLRVERDSGVAQQLIHNLAANRHQSIENVEALRWAAQEHPDANTRRLAEGYLANLPQ